jgi:hypothetical protein
MSSVGIIFKQERQSDTLAADWVPEPLGPRVNVEGIVESIMRTQASDNLALRVTIESEADSAEPRTISLSGVIKALCAAQGAQFYDAAAADFLEI